MARIYFDNGATTALDNEVLQAMVPHLQGLSANPSGIYLEAQKASNDLYTYRKKIADNLHCQHDEIFFTSGASESNSLALIGMSFNEQKRKKILYSPTEHNSVLENLYFLRDRLGYALEELAVDNYARVDLEKAYKQLSADVFICVCGFASSELGTLQPVSEIAEHCNKNGIKFHCDASNSFNFIKIDLSKIPIDSLTLSSHKIYGPKGVGVLYLKNKSKITPLILGGEQEHGVRAGTENLAAIAGLAKAVEIVGKYEATDFIAGLSTRLKDKMLKISDRIVLTGHPELRLKNHLSFIVNGLTSEDMLIKLDLRGVAASAGSACQIGKNEPLEILLKLGFNKNQASSALRLTLGKFNNIGEVESFSTIFKDAFFR